MSGPASTTPPALQGTALPPELRRWNWGAFLLNWIWGLGNGTYIALLMFVPLVNLAMPFVLGAKGNAWAWRNGDWTSVEQFRRVQRRWAIWGIVVWVAMLALVISVIPLVQSALRGSDAYRMAVERMEADPRVEAALGKPLVTGNPSGSVSTSNASGDADLTFPVSGPKGAGIVSVVARRALNAWALTGLTLRIDGSGQTLDLMGRAL